MPTDCAASYWSFGKFISDARQTSQLNAAVLMTRPRMAAEIGSTAIPILGSAKNSSSSKVTSGVARRILT